ncbi:MAG: cobalamin biosynthesis protein [Rhodobacteraceae bacterium]|nr:MAG: cobalamin biosynthesis protein [Paracoccaceae bacterium]
MIVAGFGFRKSATVESLESALAKARGGRTIDCLATAADKADHAAFQALAAQMGLPIRRVNPDAIHGVHPVTHSEYSKTHRDTGSLSEATALAMAGTQARLLAARSISDDRLATCALAQGDDT